jgi:hypothetical protein
MENRGYSKSATGKTAVSEELLYTDEGDQDWALSAKERQ